MLWYNLLGRSGKNIIRMCKVESSRQAEAGVRKRKGMGERILRQSPAVVDRVWLPIQWEVSTKEATKHCCMMRKADIESTYGKLGVGHLSSLARSDPRLPLVQGTQHPPGIF